MIDFEDDGYLLEDSRAGCFLWILLGLALLLGTIISECWEWLFVV